MAGPTVTLTLAGDEGKLEQSFRNSGKAAEKFGDEVGQAAKDVGDATDDMADSTEESTSKMGDALKGFAVGAAALGAGAAAGYAAAFENNMEIEKANDKLAAQLGLNEETSKVLGEVAGRLYADAYGDSLEDVNEAIRAIKSEGVLDAGELGIEDVTARTLDLAAAFDVDVTEATRAASQLMRTDLAGSATEAFDVIVSGLQSGLNKGDDFLDTLNEYSTNFHTLGLSATDALGLLSQGLQAGARDTDMVAVALQEFTFLTNEASDDVKDAFKAIGLNADEMRRKIAAGGPEARQALDQTLDGLRGVKNEADRTTLAVTLFGSGAQDMAGAFEGLNLDTVAVGFDNVAGASERMGETLNDNAATRIETMKRGFEGWANSLIEADGPLGSVAASVGAFGPQALTTGASLGILATSMQSLSIWSTVLAAKQAIVTAAQWAWNIAMSANPIGLVVIAIAALVGALVWLFNNNETVRNAMLSAWDAITNAVGAAVGWITNTWSSFTGWLGRSADSVRATFTSIGDAISNAFRWAFDGIRNAWNSTVGRLNFTIPSWVPGIGGAHFAAPRLHAGGVVPGPIGRDVVAVLQAGETVLPAGRSGDTAATVRFAGNTSDALATVIMALIRSGKIQLDGSF